MHINAMGTEAEPSDSSARRRKEGNVTPKRGTSGPSSGYEKRHNRAHQLPPVGPLHGGIAGLKNDYCKNVVSCHSEHDHYYGGCHCPIAIARLCL